jgi:hypothetical protein
MTEWSHVVFFVATSMLIMTVNYMLGLDLGNLTGFYIGTPTGLLVLYLLLLAVRRRLRQ